MGWAVPWLPGGSLDFHSMGGGGAGIATALRIPIWKWLLHQRDSHEKWLSPLTSTKLAHLYGVPLPSLWLPPSGKWGGCWDPGVKGWTELQVALWCEAFGEMVPLHQLEDKTLLMAPIRKCECNFLLLVISSDLAYHLTDQLASHDPFWSQGFLSMLEDS